MKVIKILGVKSQGQGTWSDEKIHEEFPKLI